MKYLVVGEKLWSRYEREFTNLSDAQWQVNELISLGYNTEIINLDTEKVISVQELYQ